MNETIEHDFENWDEARDITRWFDKHIGTEYEVDQSDDGTGSITFFDVEYSEYLELMKFLKKRGYVDG